ncbi:hypothetical protein SETIT_3G204000v2 [Setaria italica]|uniref:Uncharacterized protein n=1 Tax=Setaria italica TaxID=4555 RepID=A0A368QH20_SETIT|nr:hypothetical protein SETIT_3G204000v2 [Setaria italica]
MAMWPTEEEVREFESENAPWPCVSSPSDRCKCGILATEGVVPSELGYGSFCGNAHGDSRRESRRKLQEERELKKQRLREERDRLGYVVDPNVKYPEGSWEQYLQVVRARKRRLEMQELQQQAEEAQMETMKALVADLPVAKVNVDKKGKGVVSA